MDERQTLALQALRELLDNPDRGDWDKLVAASHTLIKAIETGQSARRLADVIMIDRNATAAAEIATLRQKLTAAEARIREMGQHNMIEADKRFASRIPTLDYMRERVAALLRDMNNPVEGCAEDRPKSLIQRPALLMERADRADANSPTCRDRVYAAGRAPCGSV